MKLHNTLKSHDDQSVNFVFDNMMEARYVRRVDDYFIVYLSSFSGCDKACRFCHLTQTGQTGTEAATMEDYLLQAETVLQYYDSIVTEVGRAQKVNFNFMARGEPLANPVVLTQAAELFSNLEFLAQKRGLSVNINISTILPKEVESLELANVFHSVTQTCCLYYSLYGVDTGFRKAWLPKAMDHQKAFSKLQQLLQSNPNINLAFHWAFIQGVNDSSSQIDQMISELTPYQFTAKFNLVRYNPFSPEQGVESDEHVLFENFERLKDFFKHPDSRMVPRVGFDVKASCGMFVICDKSCN